MPPNTLPHPALPSPPIALPRSPSLAEYDFNQLDDASRGFFGKHASQVTVAEAALLAGLVKSPSSYAPTVSLERAVVCRNTVL